MRQKPLIALLNTSAFNVYCFRREVIAGLLDKGYRVLVSCPDGTPLRLMSDLAFSHDDLQVDRRGMNPLRDAQLWLHYVRLFRRLRPAVVLTYTAKPNVWGSLAARMLHIPVVNNLTGLGSVAAAKGPKRALVMGLFRWAYRGSACVMFQNASNLAVAQREGMVRGRYRLIPGSGVALDRFPVLPYPPGGDGHTGPVVRFNYIGRVMRDKRVDDFIEAARRIRQRYPQTEFHITGFVEPTESHYTALLARLEREGVIRYTPHQDDMRPVHLAAHLTIHPSTYGEGMSNVLLESAASARPLLTTDNAGCRETVDDGLTGYIYPGEDVDALTRSIERFLALDNDVRRDMGLAGRAKMEREFDRQIVVRAYLEEVERNTTEKDQ